MPPARASARHQAGEIVGIGKRDQGCGIVAIPEHAGSAGEEDELLSPQSHRERFGDRIGNSRCRCRRLRHPPDWATTGRKRASISVMRNPGIDPVDIADVAVVDLDALSIVVHHRERETRRVCGKKVGIDPRQAHACTLCPLRPPADPR
jgi:hypothetical protein